MASSSNQQQVCANDGVQKYKIYTDSSSGLSHGNSSILGDVPDSPSWMYIDAIGNVEDSPKTYRVKLSKSPKSNVSLKSAIPEKLRQGGIIIRAKNSSSISHVSNRSELDIDGIVTELSKSMSQVSLNSLDSETDSIHNILFDNILTELDSIELQQQQNFLQQNNHANSPTHKNNHNLFNSDSQLNSNGLSPAGEALISLHLCDEHLANLSNAGVYYDNCGSELGEGNEEQLDESWSTWEKIKHYVLHYLLKPTEKSYNELKKFVTEMYKNLIPTLSNPTFQLTVLVACVTVVVAAKLLDRRRMRFPLRTFNKQLTGLVSGSSRGGGFVSEEVLEQVFRAVRAGAGTKK